MDNGSYGNEGADARVFMATEPKIRRGREQGRSDTEEKTWKDFRTFTIHSFTN